ncbi:uncharacterized protein LOC126574065 [Anopheles aquasalis]|uniref:uncharacterized protein LOC126574065 n=1 Tax=Anopheles aquasalis TaxID=42839 RepID=UPI00215AF4C7|nr:uncharacterized protein LOC126574065 [Anopheles aquasalis]
MVVYVENGELHNDWEAFLNHEYDPNEHISCRLLHYFYLGGVLQGIAEAAELPRVGLVKGGPSQYQDRSSNQPGYHAAHVVRVGEIKLKLGVEYTELFEALMIYIGHTQKVKAEVNVWYVIGGEIDRFQSSKLTALGEIDFRVKNNANEYRKVEGLLKKFNETIIPYLMNPEDNNVISVRRPLQHDWFEKYPFTAAKLYQEGHDGYRNVVDGVFQEYYKILKSGDKTN